MKHQTSMLAVLYKLSPLTWRMQTHLIRWQTILLTTCACSSLHYTFSTVFNSLRASKWSSFKCLFRSKLRLSALPRLNSGLHAISIFKGGFSGGADL